MESKFNTKGNKFFRKGNYHKAQQEYLKILSVHPEDIFARSKLARCYLAVGKIADAIAEATTVIKEDESSVEGMYVLGVAIGEHGEFNKGKDILNQALLKNSNSALLFHGLGIISLNQGKPDESIDLFEKAIQCEPTYWRASLLISEAYKSKSDFAKALNHNLRAFKLMPTLNNFYQLLVSILLRYSLFVRTLNVIMLTFLLFSKSLLYIPLAILSMGITLLISSIFFKRGDRKLGIVVIVLGLIPICWYIVRIIPSS